MACEFGSACPQGKAKEQRPTWRTSRRRPTKNATKYCDDQRDNDASEFDEKYGTEKNAFGKCVSQKAREDKVSRLRNGTAPRALGEGLGPVSVSALHRVGRAQRVQDRLQHHLASGLEQVANGGRVVAKEGEVVRVALHPVRDTGARSRTRSRTRRSRCRPEAARAPQAERPA